MRASPAADETRAGRQLLKDFVDGKLVYLEWPPDTPAELIRHTPYDDARVEGGESSEEDGEEGVGEAGPSGSAVHDAGPAVEVSGRTPVPLLDNGTFRSSASNCLSLPNGKRMGLGMEEYISECLHPLTLLKLWGCVKAEDLDMLSIKLSSRPRRADHKFHKKAARSKGNRGQDKDSGAEGTVGVMYGKKGGLVRVSGY